MLVRLGESGSALGKEVSLRWSGLMISFWYSLPIGLSVTCSRTRPSST
jgi:hypothetical protein